MSADTQVAIYAFSGDPITHGHIDVVERAANIFPKLIVAIGSNPDKTYTFSIKERKQLAQKSLAHLKNVSVMSFSGLLVDFAYEQGVDVVVKGVRNTTDFSYEQTLDSVGISQQRSIETLILFAKPELAHISSSMVKALQKEQGIIHEYVPLPVKVALEKKYSNQVLIGITGEVATGKTSLAEEIKKSAKKLGLKINILELDEISHQIQDSLTEPKYQKVRKQIADEFGPKVQKKGGSIDRSALGKIVFANPKKLERLNQIMWKPILVRLRKELQNKQGIVLIVAALLAEADLLPLCNNRIILTKNTKKTQEKELRKRGYSAKQIERRIKSQYTTVEKKKLVKNSIKQYNFGKLWEVSEKDSFDTWSKKWLRSLTK